MIIHKRQWLLKAVRGQSREWKQLAHPTFSSLCCCIVKHLIFISFKLNYRPNAKNKLRILRKSEDRRMSTFEVTDDSMWNKAAAAVQDEDTHLF